MNGGFNLISPIREALPQRRPVLECVLPVERRLACSRRELLRRRRGAVPELLERLHGCGRSRQTYDLDTWRPAGCEAGKLVVRLVHRHGFAEEVRVSFNFNMSGSEVGSENYRYNVLNLQPRPAIQATLRAEYEYRVRRCAVDREH